MYRRSFLTVMSVFVFVMVSTAYGVVIGDFESGLNGWWRLSDPNDPNVSASFSTSGATLNAGSLKVTTVRGSRDAIVFDLIGSGMVDTFRKNLKISADITRLLAEWVDPNGAYCDFTLNINAGSSSGTPWSLWQGPIQNTSWGPEQGELPISYTYDYSLILNQIHFDNLEYLELVFGTNWGGYGSGGMYYLDNVQISGGGPAYDPDPSNGTIGVGKNITLSWTPGAYARKHDVYFGTSLNDVNNAGRGNPLSVLVGQDRDANNYDVANLQSSKTYYWRIDEVNGPTIWKGNIWEFTTAASGVPSNVIGNWEGIMDGWAKGDQGTTTFGFSNTIGVTLGNQSLAVYTTGGYWDFERPSVAGLLDLSGMMLMIDVTMIASEFPGGNWTKLDKLAVNSNLGYREFPSTAINRITGLSTSADWGPWSGDAYKTLIWDLSTADWTGATETRIQIALQNTGAATGAFYLDNARLVSKASTYKASQPNPFDKAKEISNRPILSWKPGPRAVKHNLYFGASANDVNHASLTVHPNVTAVITDVNHYKPGTLELNTTYYWRVDEVNDAHPDKMWVGYVWSFTTGNYLTIDDFEDYNNFSPYRVFQTWHDGIGFSADKYFPSGYGGNNTGALIGHDIWTPGNPYYDGNIVETTIVHGGKQSMPMDYNDTKSPYYSETERVWTTAQDWTKSGMMSLSIWFRGLPPIFSESAGTYTMSASGTDIWGTADQFRYAYKQLNGDGFIIARVESVQNTHPWAKAGVMIRSTPDPSSAFANLFMTPGSGCRFQTRATPGGTCTTDDAVTTLAAVRSPHWVKLARQGDTFTAYDSNNPATEGWHPLALGPQTISMPATVCIGMSLTSHNANETCVAQFSNVSTNGNVTGANWQVQAIGTAMETKTNTPEPLYVTIEDNTGKKSPVVTYPDPNAALQNTWQEWNIPLSTFTNVKLNSINKMVIGIGKKTPAGAGSLYFDDIRLYPARCMPSMAKPAADINSDCTVDYLDLDIMADQWLKTAPPALTGDLNTDNKVNLKDFAKLAQGWLEVLLWP